MEKMRAGLFQRGQLSDVASLRNPCPLTLGTTANGIRLLAFLRLDRGRDTRKPDIGRNAETDTDRYEIRIDGNGTPDSRCRIVPVPRIVRRAFYRAVFLPLRRR